MYGHVGSHRQSSAWKCSRIQVVCMFKEGRALRLWRWPKPEPLPSLVPVVTWEFWKVLAWDWVVKWCEALRRQGGQGLQTLAIAKAWTPVIKCSCSDFKYWTILAWHLVSRRWCEAFRMQGGQGLRVWQPPKSAASLTFNQLWLGNSERFSGVKLSESKGPEGFVVASKLREGVFDVRLWVLPWLTYSKKAGSCQCLPWREAKCLAAAGIVRLKRDERVLEWAVWFSNVFSNVNSFWEKQELPLGVCWPWLDVGGTKEKTKHISILLKMVSWFGLALRAMLVMLSCFLADSFVSGEYSCQLPVVLEGVKVACNVHQSVLPQFCWILYGREVGFFQCFCAVIRERFFNNTTRTWKPNMMGPIQIVWDDERLEDPTNKQQNAHRQFFVQKAFFCFHFLRKLLCF